MTEDGRMLDGAELSILYNRLDGITQKMSNTLLRSGRSGVINRAKDFSCCIVTADCELVVSAESLPIHVLSGPDLMARSMKEFHPVLRRGDAFLHNSPYHGCSHAADHTVLMPVVDEGGTHHFTLLAKAHQADIGNSIPTTYHGTARDIYEEGALLFPAVKVQEDYEIVDDIVRMCELRIRVPDQWYGDFLAMIGAARIGEQGLLALAEDVGWSALHRFTEQWFDYSEQQMIDVIRQLPRGAAQALSVHDPIPGTPSDGIPISAAVSVKPEEAQIVVDLRDNPDALECGLNMSEACARTAALIGVFNSIDHEVMKNAGSFRRVNVYLREDCVAGIPLHPTSCSVATTNISHRIIFAVQRGFAELAEGLGQAENGCVHPPHTSVISGFDPRSGRRFANQLLLGATGGAGTGVEDAWLTMFSIGAGGMCYIDSIELDELYQPILVKSRHLLPDTEGAGKYRGAPSLYVEFGPHNCEIEVGYVSDGQENPPLGARGGLPGAGSTQSIRRRDGKLEPLPSCAQVVVRDGEFIASVTCGGGGYGPPEERERRRVLADLEEGIISPMRAESVYGLGADWDGGRA